MTKLKQLNLELENLNFDDVFLNDIDLFEKKNEYLRNEFEELRGKTHRIVEVGIEEREEKRKIKKHYNGMKKKI